MPTRAPSIAAVAVCLAAAPALYGDILTPSQDAFIRGQDSAGTNQGGSAANVQIKPANGLDFARKGYLQFDISAVTGPITAASLQLTVSFPETTTGGLPLKIWGLNNGVSGEATWNESTITWNNAPGDANNAAGATNAVALGTLFTSSDVANGSATATLNNAALLSFVNSDTNACSPSSSPATPASTPTPSASTSPPARAPAAPAPRSRSFPSRRRSPSRASAGCSCSRAAAPHADLPTRRAGPR